MSNLPQIAQLEYDTVIEGTSKPRGKSFLFDFKTGQFVLKNGKMVEATGIDALKIWIEKTVRTPKNRLAIYERTDYGCGVDSLIGSNLPFDYTQEELKRETLEALLGHEDINNITDWQFVREGSQMTLSFTVDSIYGTSQQEVTF